MNKILCIIGILFIFACTISIHAQSKNNKERYIPIVTYEPNNFNVSVITALERSPHVDYIKVYRDSNVYYINQGIENYYIGSFIRGEVDILPTVASFDLTPPFDIVDTDSIFIVTFEKAYRFSAFKDVFPIRCWGRVTKEGIRYYRNKPDDSTSISLRDIIIEDYGSIEKYKERLHQKIDRFLEEDYWHNGLHEFNVDSAVVFLQNNFIYYWETHPNDEQKSLQLFFDFLERSIEISKDQKEKIKNSIQREKNKLSIRDVASRRYYPKEYTDTTIEILGRDYSTYIQEILSEDQFKDFIQQYRMNERLRLFYILEILPSYFTTKISETGTSMVPYWDNALLVYNYKKEKGTFRIPVHEDLRILMKDFVFGQLKDSRR